jgi:arginase
MRSAPFTSLGGGSDVRRCEGLSFKQLSAALAPLVAALNWRALTLTEINHDHAPNETETFRLLIRMLSEALPT